MAAAAARSVAKLTSNLGAIDLHGPHQEAVKSTTTSLSPAAARAASNSSYTKRY